MGSTADNALTCDSEGNCMLKDKLWKMPKVAVSGSYGGVSGSISTADNALTCDSEGNCMLKDNLGSFGVGIGGNKVGVNWADNALTCDAAGDCMLGKPVKKTPAEVQQVLKAKGKCPMNYDWNKIAGGWRCSGGRHVIAPRSHQSQARTSSRCRCRDPATEGP